MNFIKSFYHWFLALGGAFFYRFPSRFVRVIGVTGTKGKTTVVELLAHIFSCAGKSVGSLSSVSVRVGEVVEKNDTGNTMPGRFFIQRFFRRAVSRGCSHVFIEVTSQGVVQHRHRFICWAGGAFLGIHPEHIESHGSFLRYLEAKTSFFRAVARNHQHDVHFFVNVLDDHAQDFVRAAFPCAVTYFPDNNAPSLSVPTLPGDLNKDNIACAVSIALAEKIPMDIIVKALQSFPGVLGRVHFIATSPITVIVDYAHTPQSLEYIYALALSLKKNKNNKLIVVLGSAGGGRDKWKRSLFGVCVAQYADSAFFTNEDPYDEDPNSIIASLKKGFDEEISKNHRSCYAEVVLDRRNAIFTAIAKARHGDVVLITGKGSEAWIHGPHGTKIPWSDIATAHEGINHFKEIIKNTA